MQPVHELLNRIHQDKDFAQANFMIGFYDRVEEHVIRKSLKEVYFDNNDHNVEPLSSSIQEDES